MLQLEIAAFAVYWPTAQSAQEETPVAEYCPAAQLVHVYAEDDAEILPAAQLIQVVLAVAPVLVEYMPALQVEQLGVVPAPLA